MEGGDSTLSSTLKNAEEYLRQGEILMIGDQLRHRMHLYKLIKDRRIDVSTFPNSFYAKEALDWLVTSKEATDRETAMKIMQKFLDYDVIHHVCNKFSVFQDERVLYRFRDDDGSLMRERQTLLLRRAERMYMRMIDQEDSILKHKEPDSDRYSRIFKGSELVDWLVKNESSSRSNGEVLGRAMVQYGILQHVSREHDFLDSDMLYQFAINFRRKRKMIEILDVYNSPIKPDAETSPFCLRKLSAELPGDGFVCVSVDNAEPKKSPVARRTSGSTLPDVYSIPNGPLRGPPSVLTRPVSVEELLAPGARYSEKLLTILSDAVGWGFVIRGTGPCYVQAVDPKGPAAGAGMKVRQFLRTVNGLCCLRIDNQTINQLIVAGPKRLVLEVLEPLD